MKVTRKGIDNQLAELRITPEERKLMEMRSKSLPYAHIAKALFQGKRSRQAVQQLEGRVKRKLWIAESAMRYKDNLSDCPIEEAPLPVRVKRAVLQAGFTKIGHLVNMREDLPDLGKQGAFYVKKLLQRWNIQKHATYCVNCGATVGNRHQEEAFEVQCPRCESQFAVTVLHKSGLNVETLLKRHAVR
jgi:DNA-directed RNA polymerase subunit RPC12/RpoP